MSSADRDTIAAAANQVDRIRCAPKYRQSWKPGDACVRLDGVTRDASGFGYMNTWQVILALPQANADAEDFLDDVLDALLEALEAVLVLSSAQQKQLVLDTSAGTVPVLVIEGKRARA